MPLKILPELESFMRPLFERERTALRESLLREGRALDPLVVWGDTLVDGHNRYRLCEELGLSYRVERKTFADVAEAKAWMVARNAAKGRGASTGGGADAVWAELHGLPYGSPLDRKRARKLIDAGAHEPVLRGTFTLMGAWLRLHPRAPRGPSGKSTAVPEVNIPAGHELKGQSTLVNEAGDLSSRWDKTQIASADEPAHEPVPEGHLIKKTSTNYGPDGTVRQQWVQASADEAARERAMQEAWARHAALYAGAAGTSTPPTDTDADMVTLYPLGDPHIGMLAWAPESGDHFDTTIAVRELLECVRQLVAGAAPSEQAIVCNLGDFMHAQDDAALTPGHGNKLDVDGRFAKVLDAGHALLRGIVDCALTKHAHVRVRNLPGNHDPRVAAELAMWLRAVYERDPRVTVEDAYAAHQYDRFGANLFGWHHGDRSKASELPAIMATDRAAEWGETTERVWHVGHVHHLTRHETPGCVVETHRTMAARDAWHAGRYRAGRSLVAIGYHRNFGEVSRVTVGLARVRAALKAKAT